MTTEHQTAETRADPLEELREELREALVFVLLATHPIGGLFADMPASNVRAVYAKVVEALDRDESGHVPPEGGNLARLPLDAGAGEDEQPVSEIAGEILGFPHGHVGPGESSPDGPAMREPAHPVVVAPRVVDRIEGDRTELDRHSVPLSQSSGHRDPASRRAGPAVGPRSWLERLTAFYASHVLHLAPISVSHLSSPVPRDVRTMTHAEWCPNNVSGDECPICALAALTPGAPDHE